MKAPKKTVALIILDGFGFTKHSLATQSPGLAEMPFYRSVLNNFPSTELEASEKYVGLPDGQMGTSEVGHLNIGAGRVYKQAIVRINDAIENKTFQDTDAFQKCIAHVKKHQSSLHLFGLLSDGGIHSSLAHCMELVSMAAESGVPTYIHCFLDGRDTPPKSAGKYLAQLQNTLTQYLNVHLSTMGGRYFGMDRDKRWDRIEIAYSAMTGSKREHVFQNYEEALAYNYGQNITDEFIQPSIIECGTNSQYVSDNDGVIFFNFRTDRPRELTRAFVDPAFQEFTRTALNNLFFVTMTDYDPTIPNVHIAFGTQVPQNTLAEWLSKNHHTQFHTAETEKYAHVTHFFNGTVESPYPGEDRKMIPSPKVATYDLQPEMSAETVKDTVIEALHSGNYDFLVVNFANPDMVGHTGNSEAVKKALSTIDQCLSEIIDVSKNGDHICLITSDHGNCEQMTYSDGSPHTAHTTNVVPFVLVSNHSYTLKLSGALCDIAPTILELMKLPKPVEMTGHSLLVQ